MNSLSWFLYGADVVQNLGTMLFVLGVFLMPVWFICTVVGFLVPWDFHMHPRSEEEGRKSKAAFAWIAPRAFALCAIMLTVSMFVPEKRTMYMMAASEMGEMVVQSEEAKEIIQELKLTVIDQLRVLRQPPVQSSPANK